MKSHSCRARQSDPMRRITLERKDRTHGAGRVASRWMTEYVIGQGPPRSQMSSGQIPLMPAEHRMSIFMAGESSGYVRLRPHLRVRTWRIRLPHRPGCRCASELGAEEIKNNHSPWPARSPTWLSSLPGERGRPPRCSERPASAQRQTRWSKEPGVRTIRSPVDRIRWLPSAPALTVTPVCENRVDIQASVGVQERGGCGSPNRQNSRRKAGGRVDREGEPGP